MSDTDNVTVSRLRGIEELYSCARHNTPLHRAWLPPGLIDRRWAYPAGNYHVCITDCEAFLAAGIPEAWSQEEAEHAKALYEAQATLDLMMDGPTDPIGG